MVVVGLPAGEPRSAIACMLQQPGTMAAVRRDSPCSPREDMGLDAGVLVSTSELEAELRRGHQDELAVSDMHGGRNASHATSRRRPRPGHYPAGFSPFRMSEKRSVVPLERRQIRNDLKVRPLCQKAGQTGSHFYDRHRSKSFASEDRKSMKRGLSLTFSLA
jgi:hypothetical protein